MSLSLTPLSLPTAESRVLDVRCQPGPGVVAGDAFADLGGALSGHLTAADGRCGDRHQGQDGNADRAGADQRNGGPAAGGTALDLVDLRPGVDVVQVAQQVRR